MVEQCVPVARGESVALVLFDDEQGGTGVADAGEHSVDLVGDDGGQAQRELIGDEQAGGCQD